MLHTVIQIIHGNMTVGDNSSLICQSITPVDIIEWLNSNGEVVASKLNATELDLTFAPVNISINNKMYTCRVNKNLVNKTAIVSVTGTSLLIIITLLFIIDLCI